MRDGQVGGLVNSALEVHELKVTTEALRAANQKIFSHMENSPLAVVELDASWALCIAPVAPRVVWLAPRRPPGRFALELVGDGARVSALRKAFHRLLAGLSAKTGSRPLSSGPTAACSTACGSTLRSSIRAARRCPSCARSRDITERVAAADRLLHLAQHDSLTGLLNRGAFMVRGTRPWAAWTGGR